MKQAHSGAHAAFATLGEAEAYLARRLRAVRAAERCAMARGDQAQHAAQGRRLHVMAFDPAIITHMRGGGVAGVEFGSEFLYGVDLWPTYDAIRCPTLVLRGAESTLLQKSTAAEMTRRGPKAEVVEFEGIGHAPWLMAEDQIKVVRDFLLAEPVEAPAASPAPGARLVA